jgi:hypothetical protein
MEVVIQDDELESLVRAWMLESMETGLADLVERGEFSPAQAEEMYRQFLDSRALKEAIAEQMAYARALVAGRIH